jgi:hypothetical protein
MTTEQKISLIADRLPARSYSVAEKVKVSAEDSKLAGHEEAEHVMTIPRYHEVNHKRRMIRAYKKHGLEGIENYLSLFFPTNRIKLSLKVLFGDMKKLTPKEIKEIKEKKLKEKIVYK